jgi:hypothetical protein
MCLKSDAAQAGTTLMLDIFISYSKQNNDTVAQWDWITAN